MEFTDQQKLIITLLTEIHEKLKIDESVDPEFVRRMVNDGHGWALSWKYPGMFEAPDEEPEAVTYVSKVLEMWSVLEGSFEALDVPGRKALSEAATPFGSNVKFPGFDGNNEHEYLSIARIFVKDLDSWTEFSGRILNSHMQTTHSYTRMIDAFSDIRDAKQACNDYTLFDVDEIAQVLNGRRHPSNA